MKPERCGRCGQLDPLGVCRARCQARKRAFKVQLPPELLGLLRRGGAR